MIFLQTFSLVNLAVLVFPKNSKIAGIGCLVEKIKLTGTQILVSPHVQMSIVKMTINSDV